ncbi:MAG: nitrite/sulfite reductase [Hyphomicrobiales bacterium]|nr:nitrite/sulfite reductase [Hyphomicrobiales bacterium]
MYRYDEFDHKIVTERVEQFRGQVARRLSGELSEDEFKPLRLMNGLYLQLHAYMLRVAVPYGTLSSRQLRQLAHIAREYDKGYAHFTTRQNVQYNWPRLADVPDILKDLADVEMHALQTSGNCIRNITTDPYAGVSADELEDPRPWAEILRQWSSLHPEFSFLPRKFKIAINGAKEDRAAILFHDIGIGMARGGNGEIGFRVYVGGGQGRTPMVAECIREFLPKTDLLAYMEAILRVYNRFGRRDNLYKSRIKILVHQIGAEAMAKQVEDEFAAIQKQGDTLNVPPSEVDRILAYFAPKNYESLGDFAPETEEARLADENFARWLDVNTAAHKIPGYRIANISTKPVGGIPGDMSADDMDAVADLADKFSFSELRVTHKQNLTFADVRGKDLHALWKALDERGLASANISLITDQIACPGLDYCNLANTRSIPIAQEISKRFEDAELQRRIGKLHINISGCINACGHHHVGHIGILGVDKKGVEYYQVGLGGSSDNNGSIGKIVGPAFARDEIVDAIGTIVDTYLKQRVNGEEFLDTYRRIGLQPFKETLYDTTQH